MEKDGEDAEDAKDNLRENYGPQRLMRTDYEFVESEPCLISLSDMSTGRSDIRMGLPGRTTPAPRVHRSYFTMFTNWSGDLSPAVSSIISTPAGSIQVVKQHEQPEGS